MNSSFRNSLGSSFNSPSGASFSISVPSTSRRRRTDAEPAIISDDGSFILEHYGTTLPSMVRVALNKVDDPANVSFRLERNGWAWLVFRRHLYIWRYTQDTIKRSTVPCRELLLPPSELFHHAKLITVLSTSSPLPACIAVSPEGHITYWPNISNESATVSINADLPGQECDTLTSVWPMGCILATTSATVLLIKPGSGSKPSLASISLNSGSKGWLGGLSKRMSYLMPMGTAAIETKRASVAVSQEREIDNRQQQRNIYVLAGTHFQVWSLTADGQHCTCDLNVHDIIRKQFQRHIWDENCDLRGIQVWLLDIEADDAKKVKILAACVNRTESNGVVNYGILSFNGSSNRIRESMMELKLVDYRCDNNEAEEDSLYSWRLLSTASVSFMVSQEKILVIGAEDSRIDTISCDRAGGPFIGSGHSPDNMACVFTPNMGLGIIRPNQTSDNYMMTESFIDIRVPDHLALSMTQNNLHDLSISEDNVNRYKSAFLHFCAKRIEESTEIINSLFPLNQPSLTPQDPIDIWTVSLCEKLMDDAPVADPRWAATFGRGDAEDPLGIKSKMLIKNFLADKKKGIEIFFSFLRTTGIWQRLTGIVVKDEIQATGSVLYNSYEKIGFAMALHFLQTDGRYRKILDPAIKSIVAMRQDSRSHSHSGLSFNDIFFKDISRVHQILSALIQMEDDILQGGDSKAILNLITLTTEVILVLFSELHLLSGKEFGQVRHAFLVPLLEDSGYEVSPWFVQFHTLESLSKQTNHLVKASQLADNSDSRLDLFKQLTQLTDIILDGLKIGIESLRRSDRYSQKLVEFEEKRASLLGNLVTLDPVGAIKLAEKYLDFNILVSVTYEEGNVEAFQEFFEKYHDLGFPVFTFEWFLKQKKDSELIECFSQTKYAPLLSEFLKDYPSIAWHHLTLNEDFYGASRTLCDLASSEESSLDNQKFLFCMSKLALLSTGTQNPVEDMETYKDINRNLDIIQFQNELPEQVLEAHGLERFTMHVLTPSQIIDMYTSALIQPPDLVNFWKAASLAKFMSPDIHAEKRLLIVARAILCDPWGDWDMDHPLDVIVPSLLYKFLSLVVSNGENLDDYLDLSELSKLDILAEVYEAGNAKYLLKACDEALRAEDSQNYA